MRTMPPAIRLALVLLLACAPQGLSAQLLSSTTNLLVLTSPESKLDPLTLNRLLDPASRSRVVIRGVDAASSSSLLELVASAGGTVLRTLQVINAQVADVPNSSLLLIAASPLVARISLDRPVTGAMERTGATVGARAVREELGYDGAGVGVAIIDSGVTPWHDDLAADGGQRVSQFVDLIRGWDNPYDDYGHGSHVAGIIAGNGFDSSGARSGIAPRAHLVVLKVLDGAGNGHISNVIAALDYVVTYRSAFNIRVVNLSVAAGVHESYNTDPLTLAAKRVIEAGIVLVAAAGNGGRNPDGRPAYGGITAPGNAPWVLTVGASSHMGTVDRADDEMAVFSSRGPSRIDYSAKPDLVAPGVGIESLSNPDSTFYSAKASYLLPGTVTTSYLPYLSLSGTSMAAPVVAGTVALMVQANPALTPNLVKAILQFTAEVHPGYDALTQGTGFMNARGAVRLARYYAGPSTSEYPDSTGWSQRLLWGNHLVEGSQLDASANAWAPDVVWGGSTTPAGQPVEWGFTDGNARNAVWGSLCGGANCRRPWTIEALGDDSGVVWGTEDPDESVVWGTSDEDDLGVVWGTTCSDSACEPTMWPGP
jgi:serine protease AprX